MQKSVAFIATFTSLDREMKEKIDRHKRSRPRHWKLVEEGKALQAAVVKLKNKYRTILIDCLGLWISNLLAEGLKDETIEKEILDLVKVISKLKVKIIIVSNEVGSGIVPDNLLARRFRNLLGLANQMMAQEADEVIFMQSGIPSTIKGKGV